MLGTSQFAGDLPCQYCSKKNAATRWPRNGDKVPFYYQKAPGKYYVAVTCPHCCKVWYVAWDDNPGPGCEVGPKAAAGVLGSEAPVARPTAVRWSCTGCAKVLKAGVDRAGKRGKCPYCGHIETVPGSTSPIAGTSAPSTPKAATIPIRQASDGAGNIVASGIEETLVGDERCVYCDQFTDPTFRESRYPRGAGHCARHNTTVECTHTCSSFSPNGRNSWWLQAEYMAGQHAYFSPWWNMYSDGPRREREAASVGKIGSAEVIDIPACLGAAFTPIATFDLPYPLKGLDLRLTADARFLVGRHSLDEAASTPKSQGALIFVWNMADRRPVWATTYSESTIPKLAVSADGQLLAACHRDKWVTIWELETGKEIVKIDLWTQTIQLHDKLKDDGPVCRSAHDLLFVDQPRMLVIADEMAIYGIDLERMVVSMRLRFATPTEATSTHLAYSAPCAEIAVTEWTGVIHLVDARTFTRNSALRRHENVTQVRFHPTCPILASVSSACYRSRMVAAGRGAVMEDKREMPGQGWLWDCRACTQLRSFGCDSGVAFDPTGRAVMGRSFEGLITAWSVRDGKELCTFADMDDARTALFLSGGASCDLPIRYATVPARCDHVLVELVSLHLERE